MRPHQQPISVLSERRVQSAQPLAARSVVPPSLHPTCMTITRSRMIPKVSHRGTIDIPLEAFLEFRDSVEAEFDANIVVHDHSTPGAYHGGPFITVPHFVLDLIAEPDDIDDIIEKINPRVDRLIERHTRQVALPTES